MKLLDNESDVIRCSVRSIIREVLRDTSQEYVDHVLWNHIFLEMWIPVLRCVIHSHCVSVKGDLL